MRQNTRQQTRESQSSQAAYIPCLPCQSLCESIRCHRGICRKDAFRAGVGSRPPSSTDDPAGNHRPPAAYWLHPRVIGWIVFLHQAVAVGSGPVEDVVRILVHVVKIHPHGLEQKLADRLRKLPAPLCIEMRVRHYIQGGSLSNIRRLHRLRRTANEQAAIAATSLMDRNRLAVYSWVEAENAKILSFGRCPADPMRTEGLVSACMLYEQTPRVRHAHGVCFISST